MKQTKLILLMMAACLAGCSSDDAEPKQAAETKQTVETPRPMIVDVQEKPILDAKTSAPMLLKRSAEYITTASLNSFSMDYLSTFHYAFTKQSGGAWNIDQNWITDVELQLQKTSELILNRAESLLKEFGLNIKAKSILKGNPSKVILSYSLSNNIDLIVASMSSQKKRIFESVSRRVLENSNADMLILKS